MDTLYEELQRLEQLVDGWRTAERIPSIERELALDKLKTLYEAVRFAEEQGAETLSIEPVKREDPIPPIAEPTPIEEEPLFVEEEPVAFDLDEVIPWEEPEMEEPVAEEQTEEEPVAQPKAEEPIEEFLAEEEPEPMAEPVAEEPIEEEPVAQPEPEPEPAQQPESVVQNSLFGLEEIPTHRRGSRRVLMSLYGDSPSVSEPNPKPNPNPQPVRERMQRSSVEHQSDPQVPASQPQEEVATPNLQPPTQPTSLGESTTVLGEVIMAEQRTLADTIVAAPSVASTLSAGPLREMIALNDRFLLISELFGGDKAAYEEAIAVLDEQPSLDDCMIYIAENYLWNPNAAGAKLLFDLLERKYGEK